MEWKESLLYLMVNIYKVPHTHFLYELSVMNEQWYDYTILLTDFIPVSDVGFFHNVLGHDVTKYVNTVTVIYNPPPFFFFKMHISCNTPQTLS